MSQAFMGPLVKFICFFVFFHGQATIDHTNVCSKLSKDQVTQLRELTGSLEKLDPLQPEQADLKVRGPHSSAHGQGLLCRDTTRRRLWCALGAR